MAETSEIKGKILTRAEEMFLKYGYSKVTMNKIASDLVMSKKTLYKYFTSKEELVREIIYKMRCAASDSIEVILSNNEMDIIKKLGEILKLIRMLSLKFEGPLLEDLYKYIPELWQQMNQFRNENLRRKFTQLINIGVEKGIFRKDIDNRLIVLIYSNTIKSIINYEILSQITFSNEQVFESAAKIIFNGIFTEEGRIMYNYNQEAG